ncbi:uncharacterized protein Z518_07931 [Rhinocladiella mackenziei CBS 650.93]|uniref:Uncharacterized protein n=1 Tax=Rhinocladiella mackenziei CBS 650.93 TaxID=1442369 RepID=A0A0D2FJ56_9EURO|nr:uncharacterized protein Z518_07931 [Rhinocladiella mackenziei CBS 650.93]KIX01992.1 hypothetical protein Z518_07931 [Rhinocladiella mackenziei CBS 650.93]
MTSSLRATPIPEKRDYHFQATDKQYKRQFARRGMRKNFNSREMKAILNDPMDSSVIRGVQVPKAKINRFVRRQRLKRPKDKTQAHLGKETVPATELEVAIPEDLSSHSPPLPHGEIFSAPRDCKLMLKTLIRTTLSFPMA